MDLSSDAQTPAQILMKAPAKVSRARHSRAKYVYPNRLNRAELPSRLKGVWPAVSAVTPPGHAELSFLDAHPARPLVSHLHFFLSIHLDRFSDQVSDVKH